MKFSDLPVDSMSVRVLPANASRFDPPIRRTADAIPVLAVKPTVIPGTFDVFLASAVVSVTPVQPRDVDRLNDELASGRSILAQLSTPAADGSLELSIAFFVGAVRDFGEIEIGVDE